MASAPGLDAPPDLAPVDWAARLHALAERARAPEPAMPLTWALHAWAAEAELHAAIRVDGSEGLIGPAPTRWRLLAHVDSPGLALAVFDGRAPLRVANVVASLLLAPERPPIVSVRRSPGGPAALSLPPSEPIHQGDRQGVTSPSVALAAFVDLALGRCARVSGSLAALPSPLRFAAALAVHERGGTLVWSAPPRRGSRRPRAFVGTRSPQLARRQLLAIEAALRKRSR